MTIESISQIPEHFQVLIAMPWVITAGVAIAVATIFFCLWWETRKAHKLLEANIEDYKIEQKRLNNVNQDLTQEIGRLKQLLEDAKISIPEKKDEEKKLKRPALKIFFTLESNLAPMELWSTEVTKDSPFKHFIYFIRWFNERGRDSEHYTWRLAQNQTALILRSTISKIDLYQKD